MDHFTQKSLLLVAAILLFVWQGRQPAFDNSLPWVPINEQYSIPVSEIISQLLCIPTLLAFYCLVYVTAGKSVSLPQVLMFLTSATIFASGHGIHVACVTVQRQLETSDNILPLVHFLHVHYSHNTFLLGLFSLLFVVVWAEKHFVQSKQGQSVRESTVNGHMDTVRGCTETVTIEVDNREPNAAVGVAMRWVWPVVMAFHLSIFAKNTSTVMITTLFYCAVLSAYVFIRQQLSLSVSQPIWTLCSRDLLILGTLVKASVVGLIVLLLY